MNDGFCVGGLAIMAADVCHQASVGWMQRIDEDICEGPLLSECGGGLYCGGHNRRSWGIMVEFDFGNMR
jgi:hypothetical protein